MPTTTDLLSEWIRHASERHLIKLADQRIAVLMAVRPNTRSVKLRMYNRHFQCWVEDIVAVSELSAAEMHRIGERGVWSDLDPWPVRELPGNANVRPLRSAPSKSWLHVQHPTARRT